MQVPPRNTTVVAAGGVATIIHRTLLDEDESVLTPFLAFNKKIFVTGGLKFNRSLQVTYDPGCCGVLLSPTDGVTCVTAEVNVTGNADTHEGTVELYLYNQSDSSLSILAAIEILVECKVLLIQTGTVYNHLFCYY